VKQNAYYCLQCGARATWQALLRSVIFDEAHQPPASITPTRR